MYAGFIWQKVKHRVKASGPLVGQTCLYDMCVAVFVALQYFTELTSILDNWFANLSREKNVYFVSKHICHCFVRLSSIALPGQRTGMLRTIVGNLSKQNLYRKIVLS